MASAPQENSPKNTGTHDLLQRSHKISALENSSLGDCNMDIDGFYILITLALKTLLFTVTKTVCQKHASSTGRISLIFCQHRSQPT